MIMPKYITYPRARDKNDAIHMCMIYDNSFLG